MGSKYAGVSLKVRSLVDQAGKVQPDSDTVTPMIENKDVLQFADFQSISSLDKLGKRKRKYKGCSCTSKLKNYVNFMKSGLLSRILYHQDGDWIDFPKEVTELVRKNFKMKRAVFEVEMYESQFILDIMYMMKLDINTGTQKPIAWIDDADNCFFPEICKIHGETQGVCYNDSCEKLIARDFNLHLQIEFSGVTDREDENVEELRVFKKTKVEKSQNVGQCDSASSDNMETSEGGLRVGFSLGNVSFSNLDSSNSSKECLINDMDISKVYEMFRAGMGNFSCPAVIEVKRCSGKLKENRLELFNTLVKNTERLRGSSNVQYAWLPCARRDLSNIISYGLGLGGFPSISAYGYGVHLSSKDHAYTSVKNCDDDENGVRHVVLCRVVLGDVEPVHFGSDQFHPSSDQFDTGVDNILDPRVHIVWEMHALTRIYPECIVSFKLTSQPEVEALTTQIRSPEALGVAPALVGSQLQLGSSNASELKYHPGKHFKNESPGRPVAAGPNIPKSPWMPFPVLFNAISNKVTPKTMHLVYHHYYLFKCKKNISRSEFVKRMRMIVGDTLLKSTIASLQSELRPPCPANLKAPKPEPAT